ncbi:hypothetical protein [Emticicia sp. C21]|uniref:hypothetical protein n=1 Tax=Emticicia sp. C21 TaxID=2302915 RepID=UPI001314B659|nr:hypothetical protein [Emticicia sp. C21]
MVGTFLIEESIGSLFKRAIGYGYQQVISEHANVQGTKATSEKVTNMVGTF